MNETPKWFLPGKGEENVGPLSVAQVLERLRRGEIGPDTNCWHRGMPDWLPLREMDEFAAALRDVRRDRTRRARVTASWLLVVAALGGGGYFLYQTIIGPAPVREARNLVAAGKYEEAGRVLAPYLQQHPENAQAQATMGEAAMFVLATRPEPWAANPGASDDSDLVLAVGCLKNAVNSDPALRSRLERSICKAEELIAPTVPDLLGRMVALQQARLTLELTNPDKLADPVIERARKLAPEQRSRQLSEPLLRQLLSWQPETADSMLELLLSTCKSPSPNDVRRFIETLRMQSGNNPQACSALAQAALEWANTAQDKTAADAALSTVAVLDPEKKSDVARRRFESLGEEVEKGDAETARRRLQSYQSELGGLSASQQSELYRVLGRKLRPTYPREAAQALEKAVQLNPALAGEADFLAEILRSQGKVGPERLTLYRKFLKDFPADPRRNEVRLMLITDAVAFARGEGRNQPEVTTNLLQEAREAAAELLAKGPETDGLDGRIFDLAKAFAERADRDPAAKKNARTVALELTAELLKALPKTPRDAEIATARDIWRKELGLGTLAPDLDTLAADVERDLKIMALGTPGAVRNLTSNPRAFHVVQVAQDCTKSKFSSEESSLLKQWVENGGILWAKNDTLEFFDITYAHSRMGTIGTFEFQPAVVPSVSPITTGVGRVVCRTYYTEVLNLQHTKVVPLLTRNGTICCSLVRYGKGWISDVKEVDPNKYDGARFWLNFRLFCLGREIPGVPAAGGAVAPVRDNPVRPADPAIPRDPVVDRMNAAYVRLRANPSDKPSLDELVALEPKLKGGEERTRCRQVIALCQLLACNDTQWKSTLGKLQGNRENSGFLAGLEERCQRCGGVGKLEAPQCAICRGQGWKNCQWCGGRGWNLFGPAARKIACVHCNGTLRVSCDSCKGSGKGKSKPCAACGGAGKVASRETANRRLQELLAGAG